MGVQVLVNHIFLFKSFSEDSRGDVNSAGQNVTYKIIHWSPRPKNAVNSC